MEEFSYKEKLERLKSARKLVGRNNYGLWYIGEEYPELSGLRRDELDNQIRALSRLLEFNYIDLAIICSDFLKGHSNEN